MVCALKIYARPKTFLREKKKQKKIKEKPTPQAGMAGKARRNGINEGKCAGMCLCRSSLLWPCAEGLRGQPIFADSFSILSN
jgi:hypothetical protein